MYPSSRQGQMNNNLVQRLTTGLRAPTGYKQNRLMNTLSYTPELNIGERPVTQHGMLGMKTGLAGPKRKVLSRSYFMVQLKKKIEELTKEIVIFREEKEEAENEIEMFQSVQTNHEELMVEVRDLEGNLADYNLAFDKQRAGTKSKDLINIQKHIAFQNQKMRTQVDQIFIERKNYEDKILGIEEQINELKNFANVKINELSVDEREEFKKLKVQVKEVEQGNKLKQKQLEELERNMREQDQRLRLDVNRMKMFGIKEEYLKYDQKERELQQKLEDCSLTFEEIRKKLISEVKMTKKEIQSLEKRSKDLKKFTKMTYKRLHKIDALLNGNDEMAEEQKLKYEILYKKEKDVEKNIVDYIQVAEQRLKEIEELEKLNLKILRNISQNSNLIKSAPKSEDLKEMNNEYQYKMKQAENSEETLQRVQNELLRRQEDLKRVDEIEESLPNRIQEFQELLQSLKSEIAYFEKKDEEKERYQKQIELLEEKISMINENQNDFDIKLKDAELEYRRKKGKRTQSNQPTQIQY